MNEVESKPKLRGVLHLIGAVIALPACITLYSSSQVNYQSATLMYSIALVSLLSISALYHVPKWSPLRRALLRRVDHAMIFVLIGGTYFPFLSALDGDTALLFGWVVCGGTFIGVGRSLLMRAKSKILRVISYGSLGLVGVFLMPAIYQQLGPYPMWMIIGGGAIYLIGALAYAFKKPNPVKNIFEYHECFHLCVNIAATLHFMAVWSVVAL